MSSAAGDHRSAAVRAEAGTRLRNVLWPACFPDARRARVPAHALAALVVFTTVYAVFAAFFYSAAVPSRLGSDENGGPFVSGLIIHAALTAGPLALMGSVLAGARRGTRGAPYWRLTIAAWTVSVLVIPLLLLWIAVMSGSNYCNEDAPLQPVAKHVVLLCVVAALASGSPASWTAWVVSKRRARPVVLYAVWLATVSAVLVLLLWHQLHTGGWEQNLRDARCTFDP